MSDTAISEEHLANVCRFGAGEAACAYVIVEDRWRCAKNTPIEATIRARHRPRTVVEARPARVSRGEAMTIIRVEATIWQGPDEALGHDHPWNVEIHRPDGDDDRGFNSLIEAYEHIERWATGRGVNVAVQFGLLLGGPCPYCLAETDDDEFGEGYICDRHRKGE